MWVSTANAGTPNAWDITTLAVLCPTPGSDSRNAQSGRTSPPSARMACAMASRCRAFVGAKQKNATKDGQGDIWTYTALDADSKLMISWLVGPRNHASTQAFMVDVAERLGNRVQLTTDGLSWYVAAVEKAFGWNGVDFAEIIKTYGMPQDETERCYTRLTNAFSKKAENHAHAFSMYAMFYNFCRAHTTLTQAANGIKTTPAMASGLTDHVWTVEEILDKMRPDYLLR